MPDRHSSLNFPNFNPWRKNLTSSRPDACHEPLVQPPSESSRYLAHSRRSSPERLLMTRKLPRLSGPDSGGSVPIPEVPVYPMLSPRFAIYDDALWHDRRATRYNPWQKREIDRARPRRALGAVVHAQVGCLSTHAVYGRAWAFFHFCYDNATANDEAWHPPGWWA